MVTKSKLRLTEALLSNRRFCKFEDAIVRVFFKHGGYTNVRRLTSEAGLVRTSFYKHHKTVARVIPDYEEYIYRKYSKAIQKYLRKNGISVKGLYRRTLFFILKERKIFRILVRAEDKKIFVRMVTRLKNYIDELDGLSGNTKNIYDIYSGEIAEIIFIWGKAGFEKETVEQVLDDIMQITTTMRVNLTKLNLYRA